MVSNTRNFNLNCDASENAGSSTTTSNKSNGLTGLQQFLKLQQPVVSSQQSMNVNLEQPTIYQTLQQPVPNQILPMQLQEQFQSLPYNLQNQVLQQQDHQAIQKQYHQLQQHDPVTTISKSQRGTKPLTSLRVTGVTLAPLPVNGDHSRNLPLQISHGVQLSNLVSPSKLPYFATKSCDCVSAVDQIPVDIPQPTHGPTSNVPISVIERTQCPVNVPISTSSLSTDSSNLNIPIALTLSMVPASTLPQKIKSQSVQSIDLAPITASRAYQSPINQVLLTQSQPLKVIQMVQPVEYQMPLNQLTLKSVESVASKGPQAIEYKPSSNQIQLVDGQSVIERQRQIPTSFVTNKNQHSNTLPINYPDPFVIQNTHGPKTSTMKALLPLLIDLLKARNCWYQYPHNCNCGCMNNNAKNSFNDNDTQIPPPEIIEGYANQRKYEAEELSMSNNIIPEDPKTPVNVPEKSKFRKYNNRPNYSEEEDDDEYEDEYDDED